ncbi:MFS general substrate transporter [Penicillium crustosum]|uniref:MFS general substrate transporter n=1 Tax=Penicillium crustosum TaxID=36656 RepID=UPI0023A6E56D|nr:MFS general substrate transporter [Penicillium crustosum]KAJ5402361.1 MFS general substrate transporter [Penicillium crustosum]
MPGKDASQESITVSDASSFDWASDTRNPHNWSRAKKAFVFLTTMLVVLNSSMGSSLTGNAIQSITKEFGVESQLQKALPMSIFLVGPIVWAPLSEEFGRRLIAITTFPLFTIFTMACALAPTWASLLVFRLFTGIFGSAIVALGPGILADIYRDPKARGWSIAVFMAVTGFGPMLGPIVSGFTSPALGWRWSFWVALIFAGVTHIFVVFFPETYGKSIAAKYTPENLMISQPTPTNKQHRSWRHILSDVLLRPLHLLVTEPIVTACSMYLALCYSIFYMSFQVFPEVFQHLYGLSPGQCGLVQLTIGAGCVLSLPIYWMYEQILRRVVQSSSGKLKQEYYRLPLACLGGPLFVISLFWLGWSSRLDVPFAVPMLAGIPFGMGFMCIFIAILNYVTDAYQVFAASANAASSCSRSFLATFLPLASYPMLSHLGIAGTCSLLGGLSALMSVIPFILIWKGEVIRSRSHFCNTLKDQHKTTRESPSPVVGEP